MIFSKTATWTFRVSAVLAALLFAKFVFPSMDFYVDSGGFGFRYPTNIEPLFNLFLLSLFISAFVAIGRLALIFIVPWWRRSHDA